MKSGDYMIHVYLLNANHFAHEDDSTVNPVIEVTCCGQTKYSTAKKDVACHTDLNVNWREHLFFEVRNMHHTEIEQASVSIKVLNKSMFRNELIGTYDFDVTNVYFQEKHCYQHQWISLFNPDCANGATITANMKVSLSVQGPGDEQVQLGDEPPGGVSSEGDMLMPAQIKRKFKQLKIRFIKAQKLPKMDTFGTIDAYIKTTFLGKTSTTTPVTAKNDECDIDQEFWLPIQMPLATDRLAMQLYDKDTASDELVGTMLFSLKDLISRGADGGEYFWQNLYGAPLGKTGSVTDAMNRNPTIASNWRGRILMLVQSEDSKNPEKREQALEDGIKKRAIDVGILKDREYEIIADVLQGVCLPSKSATKYRIKIKIGEFECLSDEPKETKKGYCSWRYRFPASPFKLPYKSLETCETVFVYLMDGSTPVCFYRAKASDFQDKNSQYKWLPMQNDLSIGAVEKANEAGLIQLKMCIRDKERDGFVDWKNEPSWSGAPVKRLKVMKIRCYIFQCRNIPAADSEGTSDAFINVWSMDSDKKYQTKVIEDSLNPIFYEAIELIYDVPSLELAAPIVLNIWDLDKGLLTDDHDYLGRAVINLQDAATVVKLGEDKSSKNVDINAIPTPKWHDIKIGFDHNTPTTGQVLCSFAIGDSDVQFAQDIKFLKLGDCIKTKEYNLDINVLGLRDLQSFGLMPVKKPFINFRIKSLLPPEKAQAVTNVKTQPGASGANPNINTNLTFALNLPKDSAFCPSLGCDVYDFVFKGLSQPLIGTFCLPIGEIKQAVEDERAEFRRMSKVVIERMAKISELGVKGLLTHQVFIRDATRKEGESKKIQPKAAQKQKGDDGMDLLGFHDTETNEIQTEREVFGDDDCSESSKDSFFENLNDMDTVSFNALTTQKIALKAIEAEIAVFRKNKETSRKTEDEETLRSMEIALKKKYHEVKENLRCEFEKARQVQQELDKRNFQAQSGCFSNTILPPYYKQDEQTKLYFEVVAKIPPSTLYKAIGFNDMALIKEIEGVCDLDPVERRDTLLKMSTNKSKVRRLEKLEDDRLEIEHRLQKTNKHYRRFYDDELENNKELFPNHPFQRYDISRGQSRGLKKSWLSFLTADKTDASGEITNEQVVGYFKGKVTVENEEERLAFKAEKESTLQSLFTQINVLHQSLYNKDFPQQNLDAIESFEDMERMTQLLAKMNITENDVVGFIRKQIQGRIISKAMNSKQQCSIQLYVLEGFDLAQRDIGSFSDPYLKITCGGVTKNERENYQLDQPNPKFYSFYEFSGEFPGAPSLSIEVFDYDDLFGDDLIGRTVIDLDDRFFSPDWQSLEEKPIESRQLYHESTSLSQGVVTCWLEIEPQLKTDKARSQKVWNVSQEPVRDYEVRLSVFDTKNIPAMDFEGTSDVYITAYLDEKDKKSTDTHYRCTDGEASFNYRMVFKTEAPRSDYELVVQAWDRDLFKSNDFICQWKLNLSKIFECVRLSQLPLNLSKNFVQSQMKNDPVLKDLEFNEDGTFWLTTRKEGVLIKIRLDLRIFPELHALSQAVGDARSDPNMEPYLPPPPNRLVLSLNPWKMMMQMMGQSFKNKMCTYICCIFCIAILVLMLPMIFSDLTSKVILKMFGIN